MMKSPTSPLLLILLSLCFSPALLAGNEASEVSSQFFKKTELLYSDDFDGEFNAKFWQKRTKNWVIQDGHLIGAPDFKNKEEAMKALKRDHHLGLGPVIRLNQIPNNFVCQLRFKFEGEKFTSGRPLLDIGHHINGLVFQKDSYKLKLSSGKRFTCEKVDYDLNQWTDLTIEFTPGKLLLTVNGKTQVYEHEQVSLKDRSEFTFKALEHHRLLIDYVRLYKGHL